jgi:anti-anti-sigma regulatory factor
MRKGANAKPRKASKARPAASAKKLPAARRKTVAAKTRPTSKAAKVAPKASGKAAAAPARLTLAAACTLREAAMLKAQLLGTVSATDTVVIDGGAVERIDTAGLQLLVAFARREAAAGRRLDWASASGELLVSGARLGLLEVLSLSSHPLPEGSP